jgi:hypothetical protein
LIIQGSQDYKDLPATVPGILVNNPKGGHMQDIMTTQGGLVALAGRSFFDWIFKNSTAGKEALLGKGGKLAAAGWQIESKNFKI